MIFFEHKNEYFLKKYNEIINYLINSNFINFNSDLVYPSNLNDISEILDKYFPSNSLLTEKISELFELKLFKEEFLKDDNSVINELGVIHNETFYFFDIFSNKSFNFYQKYKQYDILKNIGVISKENYQLLLKKDKSTFESLSLKVDSILQKAINTNTDEVFFSSEGSVLFKTYANSFYIEEKILLNKDFDYKEHNLKYNNQMYNISINKINIDSNTNFLLKIRKEDEFLFKDKKIRHYDKLNTYIHENKGIILLSSKNNSNIYYDTMKNISITNKRIISFDNEYIFKVPKVVNYKKSKLENYDLSLFDVVFINDINLHIEVFLKAVELGKLIVIFSNNKDSFIGIVNILDKTKINKYIFSENFLCSFHYTELPKLCECCKIETNIKDLNIFSENKYSIYKYGIGENKLFINNHLGCNNCIKGYEDKVYISEILINDNDIAEYIEKNFNIRQLRNFIKSKRWEGEEDNSLYLLKKGYISINDIKKYT